MSANSAELGRNAGKRDLGEPICRHSDRLAYIDSNRKAITKADNLTNVPYNYKRDMIHS